jgi:predicted lipoprotein with Yx(FWY)xxD motif
VRRVTLAVVSLAVILSTAACTEGNPLATAAPASQKPAASVQGTLILRVQNSPQLGQIVTDGNGWTLYRYDKDTAKPPRSNCGDDCWTKWPPLIDTGDIRLEGVDQTLVGSFVRTDSLTRQVTVGGWPIYRYSGDAAPGDIRGEGVGNVWYAVTPTGRKAVGANNNPGGNAAGNGTGNN